MAGGASRKVAGAAGCWVERFATIAPKAQQATSLWEKLKDTPKGKLQIERLSATIIVENQNPLGVNDLILIEINDARWKRVSRLEPQLKRAAKVVLAHLPSKFKFPWQANLLLSNDKQVRQLNRDFRGKNEATNVLSFPQFEPAGLPKKGTVGAPILLGDIAFAYQYMVAEAKRDHKILLNHTVHIMIHGLLHLFGYDHLSDADASKMERLEKKIMAELGLPDPYRSVPVKVVKSKRTTTTSHTAHTKR